MIQEELLQVSVQHLTIVFIRKINDLIEKWPEQAEGTPFIEKL